LLIANPSFPIASLSYSGSTDSTTITISTVYNQSHAFISGNKVIFDGVAGVFKVSTVNSNTQFVVEGNASGATKCYGFGISSSTKDSNSRSENLSTRQFSIYGGYSSKCTSVISVTSASFSVPSTLGLSKGDFVQVNDEIMFITDISGSGVDVLRGALSTKVSSHSLGSFVRKISVIPVELRRTSMLRASGHTFEYTGFGPGNYSTGMPTNQEKVLSNDQALISQALPTKGGLVVYTGMNSNGEFFIGRKKFDATTGEEISLSSVVVEESDPLNFFGELTVNNFTVNTRLDSSTAITVLGNTKISNDTDSINKDTGALVIENGGMGVEKSVNIGGNLKVSGITTSTGGFFGNVTGNVTGNLIGADSTATSANQIKTITRSTNADHFISFVDSNNSSSTNELLYTSANVKINPSNGNLTVTGTVTATLFDGDVSGNATSANQIKTITRSTNADHFISFVDSNNSSSTNELLYTSANVTINPSNGNLAVSGTVTANSDEKLKENIYTIENALEKVKNLRGVEYDRKDSGEHQIGVIAQEVERIIPEVVYGDETKSVAYGNLVGLLIEAIKEQQKEIDELKKNSINNPNSLE
jgi:hypothetical protein